MTTSTSKYSGELRTHSVHTQSGETYITDAPTDNEGKGEAFSPTDIVATSLANCMMTIMGIVADKKGIDLIGAKAETEKEMSKELPRRIIALRIRLTLPLPPDHPDRKILEEAALHCPVHKSLDPSIDAAIEFIWSGDHRHS